MSPESYNLSGLMYNTYAREHYDNQDGAQSIVGCNTMGSTTKLMQGQTTTDGYQYAAVNAVIVEESNRPGRLELGKTELNG